MENSITQKTENTKRYLPHDIKTKENAVKTYMNNGDIEYTCRKYHISRYSLWRWVKKYDGTKESLEDKSHKPKTRHPKSHTNQEIRWIRNYVRRNPKITLCELWSKLKREKGYTRKITSLYRVMKRLNIKFYKGMNIKNTSKKKHNKKYETPKKIGEKWQIDAKYVPNECKVKLPEEKRYYQYTCIDEASRERFLWWYEELTPVNTVDFVKRCIEYFGYKPKTIQTDNGTEFSYNQAKIKKEHPMDRLLKELKINHYKIRPRTPEHNGKVERSHRKDQERFYYNKVFCSFEDFKNRLKYWEKEYNNFPMKPLGWKSPNERLKEYKLKKSA